jgi:hypothetical protein
MPTADFHSFILLRWFGTLGTEASKMSEGEMLLMASQRRADLAYLQPSSMVPYYWDGLGF